MEEGREKVTAKSHVTQVAVRGTRTSEAEAEILSAQLDDRRFTEYAAIAGSPCTRKAMEVAAKNGAEENIPPVHEEVSRNQESKETEGIDSVEVNQDLGMEGEFVVCDDETCDNLINALKLLTNQQNDADSLVGTIVTGLLERSRSRIIDGLRKFIAEDNHEALKVGDLHWETSSKKVVKPKFTADELT